jgi:UDP-N-acetyl-D-glucosamine/UDP-N-acetyl-D-galactosamine dehydrogenase
MTRKRFSSKRIDLYLSTRHGVGTLRDGVKHLYGVATSKSLWQDHSVGLSGVESENMQTPRKIAVVGLGYVGLPLAVAFARHFEVVGYDLKASRIDALKAAHDITGEIESVELATTRASFTSNPEEMRGSHLFIITVPTPVDEEQRPDLHAVRSACAIVGKVMSAGATVVLESTVYPGVTEEICAQELAKASGLQYGADFAIGYSPERINPGDKAHTLATLTKVVAGDSPAVSSMLANVYGKVNNGNVFIARDIKTAEAAKVIENAQRDINIAFINEVAMIFAKLGISVYDVLDAARTKWNFLPFAPGLVGGHCIGVDPYYLAYKAQSVGHDPEVILAGRRTNDAMGIYIARSIASLLAPNSRVLVLGLAFKENVPDLRNSRVTDIIAQLRQGGHSVEVHDPLVDREEAREVYDIDLIGRLGGSTKYEAIIGAVPHRLYKSLGADDLAKLLVPNGLLADIKGMWRDVQMQAGFRRWTL